MIRAAAAAASQAVSAAAAAAALEAGGSAVDAITAGFLAAAGAEPGVLLAPAIAIVAGSGSGARAFDGRSVQPGTGAPRPRGFTDTSALPDGSGVAVPRALAMLTLLHTYRGRASWRSLARAGVVAAEHEGAKARAALLRKVGETGVLALRGPEIVRALLVAGGPVAGGILTEHDLRGTLPAESEAITEQLGDGTVVITSPWGDVRRVSEGVADRTGSDCEAIVACDGRGLLAALAYSPARNGILIQGFELEIGRDAVPVLRGITRVAPGTPLPAPAPLAVLRRTGGLSLALAVLGWPAITAAQVSGLASGLAVETALEELCARNGARRAIAVVTDGRTARGAAAPAAVDDPIGS